MNINQALGLEGKLKVWFFILNGIRMVRIWYYYFQKEAIFFILIFARNYQ